MIKGWTHAYCMGVRRDGDVDEGGGNGGADTVGTANCRSYSRSYIRGTRDACRV